MPFAWDTAEADAYVGRRGRGFIWRPLPDVLVTQLLGRAEIGAARFYIERADAIVREGHAVTTFHDWWYVDGYDPEARQALRAFGADREKFGEVHYLVQSTLVALAITTAAMTLGRKLVAHARREPFIARLEELLAERG